MALSGLIYRSREVYGDEHSCADIIDTDEERAEGATSEPLAHPIEPSADLASAREAGPSPAGRVSADIPSETCFFCGKAVAKDRLRVCCLYICDDCAEAVR